MDHRWFGKHERKIYGWAVLVWLGPGAAVSWLLQDSVAWVTAMSWYAIVVAHGTMWIAKRAQEANEQ